MTQPKYFQSNNWEKMVKPKPHTNEYWFCLLSTEEKAKFFHGIVIRTMQATWGGKKPDYPAYLFDWKKWLKQPHTAK